MCTVCQLHNYVCGHINDSPMLNLPSRYPIRHSYDKIFQALYHFSVLQGVETCVGPGNEAPFWEEKSSAIETVYYLSHACTMQNTLSVQQCVWSNCVRAAT